MDSSKKLDSKKVNNKYIKILNSETTFDTEKTTMENEIK